MTEDLTRGNTEDTGAELANSEPGAASQGVTGAEGAEQLIGQASVTIGRPAAGEIVQISAEPGSTYVLDFDPSQARAVVEGDNLILVFEDGGQIVFENLVSLAQLEGGPSLQYAGEDIIALLQAQGIIPGVLEGFELTQPDPGQIILIQAELGQRFIINFDPALAQISVDGDNLVMTFPNGGQIIIAGLGALADDPNGPVFSIAGADIPGGTLIGTAVALTESEAGPDATATLETAAGGEGPVGTGATQYSDDLGDIIDTIDAQGVIPPVEGDSVLIDLEPTDVEFIVETPDTPPSADPVLTPADTGGEGLPGGVLALFGGGGGGGEGALYGLSSTTNSLYLIDPDTGEATFVSDIDGGDLEASFTGLSFLNGTLFATDIENGEGGELPSGWNVGTLDVSDGAFSFLNDQDGSSNWWALATDETNNLLYTIDSDDNNILKSMTADGTIISIGTGTGIEGVGMAFDDANGILYVIDLSGDLYTVDTTTGVATLIGSTGLGGIDIGLAYDENTNTLFANDGDTDSLYILDTDNGQSTLVGSNLAAGIDGLAWIGGDAEIAFFKEITVDGQIGDDDFFAAGEGDVDMGGADGETALGSLVFTLTSLPTGDGQPFGSLVLESGGVFSVMLVGETYTSEDTIWWVATQTDVGEFEVLPDVTFDYSVTDADGNVASATVTITTGDQPSIGDPVDTSVDEEGLSGNAGDSYGDGGDLTGEATTSGGSLDITYGGDGAGGVTFDGTQTGLSGLTSGGVAMSFVILGGGTLIGYTTDEAEPTSTSDSNVVYYATLDGTGSGSYSFTLVQVLDHDIADTEDDETLTFAFTATDSDGDTASGSFTVTVDDDAPTATDDGELASLNDDASGVIIGTVAGILSNDSYGADGAADTDSITIAGGNLGGTVTIDGGNLVYTSATDIAPGETTTETFVYTIKDADGDTITATFTVQLTENGPSIGDPVDTSVDEEGLSGNAGDSYGDGGDLTGEATTSGGSLDITYGGDGAGGVTFDGTQTGLSGLTSGGVAMSFVILGGGTLIGYTTDEAEPTSTSDSNVVYYATLDGTGSGSYSFTLVQVLDHDIADTEDDETLTFAFTATDSDGDTASGSFTVTVDDDGPVAVTADKAFVANSGDAVGSGDLNFLGNVGADQDGDIQFDSALTGTLLERSGGGGITSGGEVIFLSVSGDGHTLTAWADTDGDFATTGDQTQVFTIVLDPSGDSYTIDFDAALDDGGGIVFENFSQAPAGQNSWIGIDDPRDPLIDGPADLNEDLLFTGFNPDETSVDNDTINTSSFGVGTNSQSIVVGDMLRLDYVENINITTGDAKDLDTLTYDQHYTVNDASFTIIQTGGPATNQVDVLVQVYDADDDQGVDWDTGDDAQDIITSITIYDGSGALVGTWTSDSSWVDFDYDGNGGVLIMDILVGYEVFVSTDDGFNRMEMTNVTSEGAANDTFDLGGFEVTSVGAGEPIDMEFDLIVSDEDGDTADGTLLVTTNPDGGSVLVGTGADETLIGGSGDDTLTGGGGSDNLTGGAGADTFVYAAGAGGGTVDLADVITDFEDNIDSIDLVSFGLTGLGDGRLSITDDGFDTTIVVDGESLAVVTGILTGALSDDIDFV